MHAEIQAFDNQVAVSLMVEAQGWGRKGDRIVHRSGTQVGGPGAARVVARKAERACRELGIPVTVSADLTGLEYQSPR